MSYKHPLPKEFEYEILQEYSKQDIELILNKRAKNGWEPCGNLVISWADNGNIHRHCLLIRKQIK